MVAMREHLNKNIRKNVKESHVEQLGVARMKRDERDVRNIKSCLDTWLPQLWNPDQSITNIATGVVATKEMTNDTVDMKERGTIARDEFINRFTSESSDLSHYHPIKRQPVKLFNKDKAKKVNLLQRVFFI